jgi:hypothetical protein
MSPQDVLSAIQQYGEPELKQLMGGLPSQLPIGSLLELSVNVAQEIAARNELDAMKAAVSAADASVDAEEQAALAAEGTKP